MEKLHIVSRHDESIGRIISGILDMGDLVILQLRQATDALDNFEADTVDQLIATDRTINGMYKDIHSRSERLIALRQPMALDLRQALSPINIASNLERIGDHAKSTAKRARRLAGQTPDLALLCVIQKMSNTVQTMLLEVLRAYKESDTDLAADIRARDLEMDQLNKDVFATAVAAIERAPDRAETYTHIILLARGFERVGDHVVNIARDVHQIVTGDDLKAADSIN